MLLINELNHIKDLFIAILFPYCHCELYLVPLLLGRCAHLEANLAFDTSVCFL